MCSAWAEVGVRSAPKQCVGETGRNQLLVGLEPGGRSCRALLATNLPGGAWQSVKGVQLSAELFSWPRMQERQRIRCNVEKAGARKALQSMEDSPGIAVRWQGCLIRNPARFARNCGRSRKRSTQRCRAEVGDSASASPESSNRRESEPSDVEEEFERWSRGQLASVLARDTEFSVDMGRSDPWDSDSDQDNSVDMRRSDPWDSDSDQEDTPSTSGRSNLPGEVSLEAASVLGGTKVGASFPVSSSALSAEMSGLTDEPIKVEVEAQDASQMGMNVLRLLAEMEKKKQAEKAQAKGMWLQSFTHEASR
jgi:hypothetical protein